MVMKMENNNLKEAYHNMEKIHRIIQDIDYFLPYLSDEDYKDIKNLSSKITSLRKNYVKDLNSPLIALKNYTEGKCSWERAGEMCDLHIFGLRNYCEQRNVDWSVLRIDEYYGVEGEEGINKIKENWNILDPNKEVYPVKYNGDSLYVQYPFMEHLSNNEQNYNDASKSYIKYKAKMLISEYACEFYKTLNYFVEHNRELEDEINFYKNSHIGKDISRFYNGINISEKDDLEFLEFTLDLCYIFLKDAKKTNNLENVLNSFYKLEGILNNEYYYYTINQDKKPTEKSAEQFKDMIVNISKGEWNNE